MKGKVFKEPVFYGVTEGRITQFREIVKPQPKGKLTGWNKFPLTIEYLPDFEDAWYCRSEDGIEYIKPRFGVGDKVYIKEPYYHDCFNKTVYLYGNEGKYPLLDSATRRKLDGWKNKLFMPEGYARYFIDITAVRCERVKDISDEDCLKEGIYKNYNQGYGYSFDTDVYLHETPQEAYAAFFNQIHGKGAWERNPYVWVWDFKGIS